MAAIAALFALLLSLLVPPPAQAAPAPMLADAFDRSAASGWGSPESGSYVANTAVVSSVDPGTAILEPVAPGRTASMSWRGSTLRDIETRTDFRIPTIPSTGRGVYFGAHLRATGEASYAARVRVLPGGRAELALVRTEGVQSRVLQERTVPVDVQADSALEVRAIGSDPTVLQARVWNTSDPVPEWQLEREERASAGLGGAGAVAWSAYSSSAGPALPVELTAVRAGAPAPEALPEPEPGPEPAPEPAPEPTPWPEAGEAVLVDDFDRQLGNGWGASESGVDWVPTPGAVLSVSPNGGSISSPAPGRTSVVTAEGLSLSDAAMRLEVRIPELPRGGGGLYLTSGLRATDAGSVGARVRVHPSGSVDLALVQTTGLTETTILREVRLATRVGAGDTLRVRVSAVGHPRIELAASAWLATVDEPAEWDLTAASAGGAAPAGEVRLSLYTSQGSAVAPLMIGALRVSGTDVRPAPGPEPAPEPAPEPQPGQDPESALRGNPGAAAPGTLSYAVPSGAVFVAPSGDDTRAGDRAAPLKTIAAALRAVPNGGTIVLRAGSYHEEVLVPPQRRVTIQPYPGEEVWLDGAAPVTGWQASGGAWVKSGWDLELDPSPTYSRGKPDNTQAGWQFVNPEHPMAAHPDQVWVGGEKLRQVASRGQVVRGAFYVDRDRDELVIGTDPTGKRVEASTLVQALSVRSVGSEVRGIGVRRYAPSVPDMGAVIAAAADVTFTDVTIRDNATTGFYSWSPSTTLRRVSMIDNGMLGGGAATADGLRLEGVLSTGNNAERFNRAPVSGAFKIGRSRDVAVVDSAFIDNFGQGPWFDESVYNIRFTGNDVIGNTGNGVVLELSDTAIVADNVVADNALTGIYVINTGNAQLWNNTVVDNTRNINITQDRRRAATATTGHDPRQPKPDPTMPWITRNTVVANNVVGSPSGNCLVCVEDSSREFTAANMVAWTDGNLYHRDAASSPRWFGVWSRGSAGNPEVTDTLELFRAATGQETRSRLVEGGSLVTEDYRLRDAYATNQAAIARSVPAAVAAASHLDRGSQLLGAQRR
jgi:parallel beta-helix repeat protein